MSKENAVVAHHFQTYEQQRESASLGMWLFVGQEIMFFGGLFFAYALYRWMNFEIFVDCSRTLSLPIGFGNTLVLLSSSLTMAMAVYSCQKDNMKHLMLFLGLTLFLGLVFMGVKAFEYHGKWEHGLIPLLSWHPHEPYVSAAILQNLPRAQMFYVLYFLLTGLHALHMVIGVGILIWLMIWTARGKFGAQRDVTIENFGLYWHFVDIVWVFLFPMLYLIT